MDNTFLGLDSEFFGNLVYGVVAIYTIIRNFFGIALIFYNNWDALNILRWVLSVYNFGRALLTIHRIFFGDSGSSIYQVGMTMINVFGFNITLIGLISALLATSGVIGKGFTLYNSLKVVLAILQLIGGKMDLYNSIIAGITVLLG